jgi:hypothetical protein
MPININIPFCPNVNTNDYDIFIKNLLRDIIKFNQIASNHCDYDIQNDFSYYSQVFKNGKVVDNNGIDINRNNLAVIDNINETNFMVTYERDNKKVYDPNCRHTVAYWIYIKVKDCEPNFARLNSLADVFISMVTDQTNKNYTIEFTSTYGFGNIPGKKHKYTTRLDKAILLERSDALKESHNSKNYLYTVIKIELDITPTVF